MKPLSLISLLAALALALPVQAQNASQIAAVRGGANCPGCNLFQADFSGLAIKGRNLAGARLRQANLSLSFLNRSNLSGTDLRDIDAYGGVFSSTNFARADLTHASLVGTYMEGANFAGARLEGTNLSGAQMYRARGLSQAQLNHACGDGATHLPPGLRVPSC